MTDPVSEALALNVRAGRRARGWRLVDLAERSGVSRSMLQQVETARANPSIGTIARIADTLGVPVGRLVEPPAELGAVSRAADVPIRRCGARGRSEARLMINDGRAPFLELWDFRIGRGDEIRSPGHPAGTREFLAVTAGLLVVEVGGATFDLATGDTLGMRGDRPHVYRNPGRATTHLTMTVVYSGEPDSRFTPNNA
ncbi:HTH-type transcriptional regulator SutR [Actinosynnema sp. ALI-1.44]